MRAVGRELIRRGFVKADVKETVYLDDVGRVEDITGEEIALAKWNNKNECWDFDINIDIEFTETHPKSDYICAFSDTEHCNICPWKEGCNQKDKPKEVTPTPPKVDIEKERKIIKNRQEMREWIENDTPKEPTKPTPKKDTYSDWKKKKNPPVID